MKTLLLSVLFLFMLGHCRSQTNYPSYTSLNENFDRSCATVGGFPANWVQVADNPDPNTQPWMCTQGKGINNSPCMSINDYVNGSDHADTVWLITPKLDLSSYSSIYFNFFDRYSRNGDSLGVYVINNYSGDGNPLCDICTWTEIIVPFTNADSVWQMHEIDLTPYKADPPLYVGFKYMSSATSGSIWYLDSVFTSPHKVGINNVIKENIPVTVIGVPGNDGISLECTIPVAGSYSMALSDITGRVISSRSYMMHEGLQHITLNDVNLSKGMYLVRLGNDSYSGFAKAAVQ